MIAANRYGPWAVIAGGSEGVGACFARRLAGAGINLVLLARKRVPLDALTTELRAAYRVQIRKLAIDLATDDALARVREVTDDIEVGLLIYNAGAGSGFREFLEQPAEDVMSLIRLNVAGPTAFSHHFAARMAERGRGGIMFVGSGGAAAGCAGLATYCGSKSYLQTFGEALWMELKPRGIDVLVLVLGRTQTPALLRTEVANPSGLSAADPDEMAALGLQHLADGPVCVAPAMADMVQRLRAMPRREAVERMSNAVRPVESLR